MQIYSRNIEIFLKTIKLKARLILNDEMKLIYKKSRVHHNGYTYPLKFVVFEDSKKLGFFDPHTFQIGINKNLMLSAKTQVISNILRHELVHFYHFLMDDQTTSPHDKIYKELCTQFGYGTDVSSAAANIEDLNQAIEGDLASEKLLIKIKKLLSLAESDNIHERELATLKANQLLLKHNINRYQLNKMNNNDLNEDEDEEICLKKVFEAKKTTAKMQAIYEILGCFFVQPVFNHGKGLVYLEVIGSRINVEFADYITQFLDFELENIWQFHKKEHSLKGIKAKNSFFKGVGKGYVDKIQIQHKEVTTGNELVILKQELEQQVSKVYGRLSFSKTSAGTCHDSLSLGKSAGQALNIRKGLTSSKSSNRLLSYFKSENKS